MRAVRVTAFGQPLEVIDVDDPVQGAGRSIVQVAAATVGHVDRTIWSGAFLRHPPLPYTPGVEGAGTIVSSETYAIGSRVWIRGGGLGTATDGTWSQMVSAPDDSMGALPDAVSFTIGSAFFSPCTSAWVALRDVGGLQPGERVAVTGATGAVGALTCQLALEAGASAVNAIVGSQEKAALVAPGATAVVVERGAPGLPAGLEVDLLIDTVGGPTLEAVLPAVVPGGRAVPLGYLAGTSVTLDLPVFIQRDVSLLPLNMIRREAAGRAAAPALLERLASGQLMLDVTSFPLDDAAVALAWIVSSGHQGRAVLTPGRRRRDR